MIDWTQLVCIPFGFGCWVGIVIGVLIMFLIFFRYLSPHKIIVPSILCPHGYVNWDDCPDCSH
jgi:hypothetical protein